MQVDGDEGGVRPASGGDADAGGNGLHDLDHAYFRDSLGTGAQLLPETSPWQLRRDKDNPIERLNRILERKQLDEEEVERRRHQDKQLRARLKRELELEDANDLDPVMSKKIVQRIEHMEASGSSYLAHDEPAGASTATEAELALRGDEGSSLRFERQMQLLKTKLQAYSLMTPEDKQQETGMREHLSSDATLQEKFDQAVEVYRQVSTSSDIQVPYRCPHAIRGLTE